MKFTSFVEVETTYGTRHVTPDTFLAIERLKERVAELADAELYIDGPHDTNWEFGMEETGREIRLQLRQNGRIVTPLLWSLVIPLGFTPWDRYPVASPTEQVFHMIGPWQQVYTHLTSAGWGAYAWSSTCLSARVDVGWWNDEFVPMVAGRQTEVYVQSHLHRLGHNIGVIDGRIKTGEIRAIQSLGLVSSDLNAVAAKIPSITPGLVETETSIGHIVVPGGLASVQGFGQVHATLTPQGATLNIEGPGRVVFDIDGRS